MGRGYKSTNTFNAHDSNTICDVTGFKVKRSEVVKRWDGFYVTPNAWHPRHPQDFPPKLVKQFVHKDVRVEQVTSDTAAGSFDII